MSKEPQGLFLHETQIKGKDAHRQRVLLHQQKVAALVECATEYAHRPTDPQTIANLLKIALEFAENVP